MSSEFDMMDLMAATEDPPSESDSVFAVPSEEDSAREFRRASQQGTRMSVPGNDLDRIDGPITVDEEDQMSWDEKRWGVGTVEGLRLMRRFERAYDAAIPATQTLIEADIAGNRWLPHVARLRQAMALTGVGVGGAAAATWKATRDRRKWQDRHVSRYAAMSERLDAAAANATKTLRFRPTSKAISLQLRFWEAPRFDGTGEKRLRAITEAVQQIRQQPRGREFLESLARR